MKVLFLDFDGVLNVYPNPSRNGSFHKPSCINLEMLLNKVPDLKIVVSSSWRTYGLDAVKDVLKSNGIDPRRVIDVTGHEESPDKRDHRGFQVENWLKRHSNVKKFAIVDDNNDFVPLHDKLVQTNKTAGLTQANVEKLLDILGN
jgi:hypothetical protein